MRRNMTRKWFTWLALTFNYGTRAVAAPRSARGSVIEGIKSLNTQEADLAAAELA
ncbi:hypothetical protein BH18ACI4_BH18ACI4_02100 [soil metagenome]